MKLTLLLALPIGFLIDLIIGDPPGWPHPGIWIGKLISLLECIVVIDLPREIRLARVRERSFQKFGERILAGGDLAERENAWFAQVEHRPEDYVEKWLETIDCPVIHMDGTRPIE